MYKEEVNKLSLVPCGNNMGHLSTSSMRIQTVRTQHVQGGGFTKMGPYYSHYWKLVFPLPIYQGHLTTGLLGVRWEG